MGKYPRVYNLEHIHINFSLGSGDVQFETT